MNVKENSEEPQYQLFKLTEQFMLVHSFSTWFAWLIGCSVYAVIAFTVYYTEKLKASEYSEMFDIKLILLLHLPVTQDHYNKVFSIDQKYQVLLLT